MSLNWEIVHYLLRVVFISDSQDALITSHLSLLAPLSLSLASLLAPPPCIHSCLLAHDRPAHSPNQPPTKKEWRQTAGKPAASKKNRELSSERREERGGHSLGCMIRMRESMIRRRVIICNLYKLLHNGHTRVPFNWTKIRLMILLEYANLARHTGRWGQNPAPAYLTSKQQKNKNKYYFRPHCLLADITKQKQNLQPQVAILYIFLPSRARSEVSCFTNIWIFIPLVISYYY